MNLQPFLEEIRSLMKEVMTTISTEWEIKSPIPQVILKRKVEQVVF